MDLRITSLTLNGYRKLYTGMNIDHLYIDFTQFPYELSLLVGDSGSGKTAILRSIHPFAYNNAAGDDILNDEFIMESRDGQKVITYDLDNVPIVCEHLYLRKNGKIQTKSFFSVNGEELNPSGLSTTFKELVYQYFCIDESFLALLSLGSDVKGLVERTAGERKQTAVKLFTELNIYMEYYKNATEHVKQLKTVLTNVTDKLTKYRNYDKREVELEIKDLKNSIRGDETTLENILREEGALSSELSKHEESYKEYETDKSKVLSLLGQIDSIKGKRHTDMDEILLENKKEEILKKCIELELWISSTESSLESELNFKETNLATKETLTNSIKRTKEHTNQQELNRLIASIEAELAELVDVECKIGINYRELRERCVTALAYLDNLRGMCTDLITDVDIQSLILPTLKKFCSDKNFEYALDAKVAAVSERLQQLQVSYNLHNTNKLPDIKLSEDNNCKKRCPYRDWYKLCLETCNSSDEKVRGKIESEQSDLKKVEQSREIVYILKKLYAYIDANADKLNVIPTDIFDPNGFIEKYLTGTDRQIYDEDKLLTIIKEFELSTRKADLLAKKKDTEERLAGLKGTIESYEEMKRTLERVERTIQDTENHIAVLQKDLEYNRQQYDESKKLLDELDNELKVAKALTNLRTELADTKHRLSAMDDDRERFESLSKQLQTLQDTEHATQQRVEMNRSRLSHLSTTLSTLESLEQEKLVLAEKYEKGILIKEAVSPSKGIPMEFIDNVIRNQMIDNVNELMHIAYPDVTLLKGEKELVIDEKNFTMPYRKKNKVISDISEASGGERAMLKVAFSLVIIRLVSKVYNIVLLDEMDAALDKHGRSKYIDIIELYRRRIRANQMFLISHNNMFDMYDVNILRTTAGQTTENSINLYEGGTI